MARKTRSPFHRTNLDNMAALRSIAEATRKWARECAAERVELFPAVSTVFPFGAPLDRIRLFEYRALRRLMRLPNWNAIYEGRRLAFMKRYDARAYETHLLRGRVDELQSQVEALA
jgi:hypothetical protein